MKKAIEKYIASGGVLPVLKSLSRIAKTEVREVSFVGNEIVILLKITNSRGQVAPIKQGLNIYHLIFDTSLGFIESLVELEGWEKRSAVILEMPCKSSCEECLDSDGEKCIVCNHCDTTITEYDDDYWHNNIENNDLCEICYDNLKVEKGGKSAAYHRSKMAKDMTLEQIKEYVNRLGEEG
jgi:hypothetical protein